MNLISFIISFICLLVTFLVLLVHKANRSRSSAAVLLSLNIGLYTFASFFTSSDDRSRSLLDSFCMIQGLAMSYVIISTSLSVVIRLCFDIFSIIYGKVEHNDNSWSRLLLTVLFCVIIPLITTITLNEIDNTVVIGQWYCIAGTLNFYKHVTNRCIHFTIVFVGSVMT